MQVGFAAAVSRTLPDPALAFLRHALLAAGALLLLCPHAHAQAAPPSQLVCRDQASATGSYARGCDMSYKNTEVMCDKLGTYSSCPSQPMPMKQTEKLSFITDFSPYLFAYVRDPDDKDKPYVGPYYRGTPGDASQTFMMTGKPGKDGRPAANCIAQLQFTGTPSSPQDEAKMVRLQLDNCTNQYILNSALYPYQKENSLLLSGEDPKDGSKRISLATSCQPLNAVAETQNEYFASDYIKAAWIKLLKDPSYRKNPKAKSEPHMPDGVKIAKPIEPPSPFPDVRLSSISTVKYEEINDPSHPFSPRWDFEDNERDKYSPKTKSYSNDSKNAVFCAGDKSSNINKVDVLSFRDAALKFDDKIMDRINFNKNCKANTGMQYGSCCLVVGLTCVFQPCGKCYDMKPDKPVCSTNYLGSPDRAKVKATYLPVHPALRVVGAVGSLSNMSLSNLNRLTGGVLNVAQATGLLNAQLNILSALPRSITLRQALPLLGVHSSLLQNIPRTLSVNSVGNLLRTQTNLLNNLPFGLSYQQTVALLQGQSYGLKALGSAVGLPVGQVMYALDSPRGLLNTVYAETPLGDLKRDFTHQLNIIDHFAGMNLTVAQASKRLGANVDILANLPDNMTLGQAAARGMRLADVDLPGDMTVGDAKRLIDASQQGMLGFDQHAEMRLFNQVVGPQIKGLMALPTGINAGQASQMLRSVQEVLKVPGEAARTAGQLTNAVSKEGSIIANASGMVDAGELSKVTGVLDSQMGGITDMTKELGGLSGDVGEAAGIAGRLGTVGGASRLLGADPRQLGQLLGVRDGMLNSLGKDLGLDGMNAALKGQLGGLSNLMKDLPISDVTSLLNSQLGSLSGLAGNLKLGSLAGKIDQKLLGGITDLTGKLDLKSIPGLNLAKLAQQLPRVDLQKLLGRIPNLGLDKINAILDGKLSLSSIPGINDALRKIPDLNQILSKVPGLGKLLNGLPGTQLTELPTTVVLDMLPVWQRTAKCNPNEFGENNSDTMDSLCRRLRAPYSNLNKLKMRYDNPDDPDTVSLTGGVAEGMRFKDYFGDHMPYPKLWDTGRSIQKTAADDQDPNDTSGQYTAIVGVGHEGTPKAAGAAAAGGDDRSGQAKTLAAQDQRCLYGGWGEDASFAGVTIKVPDAVSSWTELKLYQARTLRDLNISCLGRYEKTFKSGSTENMILNSLGADYAVGYVSICERAHPEKCTVKSFAQIKKEGGQMPKSDDTHLVIMQTKNEAFSLGWRGYLSAPDENQRFPNFPKKAAGELQTGLDNAQINDIIMLPDGAGKDKDVRGLPTLALVVEANLPKTSDCASKNYCYVKVMEANNGKWPDVCGTTDGWGEMKTRYIFKPGMLPDAVKKEYSRIKARSDCSDPHLSYCEMKDWDSLKIYRVNGDVRDGNAKMEAPATP